MTLALKTRVPSQARRPRSSDRRSLTSRQQPKQRQAAQAPPSSSKRPVASPKTADHGPLKLVSSDRLLHSVPDPTPAPMVVKVLAALQTGSSWVAGLVVLASLGTYGYSVHVDRQLHQTNSRLHRLQRSEQQLTTVNEVLKNHIAQQAERPSTDLQPPRPGNVIFLKPASSRPASPPPAAEPPLVAPSPETPLGY